MHTVTRDEMLHFILGNVPVLFEPGENWAYSNSGVWLLAYIVEKVSGQSFGEYLEKSIFQPFGMTRSALNDYGAIISNRASGYVSDAGGFANVTCPLPPIIPFGAGGLVSTTQDLQRFLYLLHTGDQVSDSLRKSIFDHVTLDDGRTVFTSTGLFQTGSFFGHTKHEHPGTMAGFTAQASYYPDDEGGFGGTISINGLGYRFERIP